MKSFLSLLTLASSAHAFSAPSFIRSSSNAPSSSISSSALHATTADENNGGGGSRRQLLQTTISAVAANFLLPPQFASAAAVSSSASSASSSSSSSASSLSSVDDYAATIEQSTQLLSQRLGHALSVIDGLNTQAQRLGSSATPATHNIAILEGMDSQARRLILDLSTSQEILSTIKSQAKQITISDENFASISGSVAHATSVLDGLMSQSKRLVSATTKANESNGYYTTEDRIIYMLSVLDGLNAQVRRLDKGKNYGGEDVFKILDELNAKAAKALL